ncbi:MAG TPA: DNA helicase RecG, partial [Cyanobacteria bacterium UBA11372]|nr:DNA helicase RecG [Cyanobacteria bacterium UBA11372]
MTYNQLDWERLQKALVVEAERGFTDLVGKQYRFSEFVCLSFGQPLPDSSLIERRQWQEMASRFANYPQLTLEERQHLVATASRFLAQIQQGSRGDAGNDSQKTTNYQLPITNYQLPRTTPVNQSNQTILLDQSLGNLPGIGRRGEYLAQKLGLYTVRDVLFYYPRDYIDYARQVDIANLIEGETVTLVGTVKRCNCFTSPKNKKLTIFELLLKDKTGQVKLNRFYAGTRYSNRPWQEGMKNRYTEGTVVAASGLVKKNKYGITIDNPEIEVLGDLEDTIDSHGIGRVVPVYPLTEGVPADLMRRVAMAALPAAKQLEDPLPVALRDRYGLMGLQDAIANIHFPADTATKQAARHRLVFDEFFYLQLGFLQRRQTLRR